MQFLYNILELLPLINNLSLDNQQPAEALSNEETRTENMEIENIALNNEGTLD